MKEGIFKSRWTTLSILCAIIITTTVFFACEDYEYNTHDHKDERGFLEIKTYDELGSDRNFQKIFNHFQRTQKQRRLMGRDGDTISLEIDSSRVHVISGMSYKTYNFLVNKFGSEKTQNLVFEIKNLNTADEEIKMYLAEYDLTEVILSPDKITLYEIDEQNRINLVTTCISYTITLMTPCSCDGKHTSPNDPSCTCVSLGGTAASSVTQNVFTCVTNEVWNPDPAANPEMGGGSGPTPIHVGPVKMSAADQKKKKFWMWLGNNEPDCDTPLTQKQKDQINQIIGQSLELSDSDSQTCNPAAGENEQFTEIKEMIDATCGESNIDFAKSFASPAYIDFHLIDTTTAAGKKLDCIYQKLMKSCNFTDLFVKVFGGNGDASDKCIVRFQIVDSHPAPHNNSIAICDPQEELVNGELKLVNVIKVKKSFLTGSDELSNILMAKTIVHELMHAYLNVTAQTCITGTTYQTLSNMTLNQFINQFYANFQCDIIPDNPATPQNEASNQSEHSFIFEQMMPTFMDIFSEIYEDLISPSVRSYLENQITPAGTPFNWNDFFYNLSLRGLHESTSFNQQIGSNPTIYAKYNWYSAKSASCTKDCQ